MRRAHKSIWYWSRGKGQTFRISGDELLVLAQLGYLRPNDFLWRPGFRRWRAVTSIPGILIPPPLPLAVHPTSPSDGLNTRKDSSLSKTAWKIGQWLNRRLFSSEHVRYFSSQWGRKCRQLPWPRLVAGTILPCKHNGVVGGLLFVLILVGLVSVAIWALAVVTPPHLQASQSQQVPEIALNAPDGATVLLSNVLSGPKKISRQSKSESSGDGNITLTQASNLQPAPVPAESVVAEPGSGTILLLPTRKPLRQEPIVPLPARKPSSDGMIVPVSAPLTDTVPLPTRKPIGASQSPYGEGAGTKAKRQRMARRKVRQLVPMPFGSFGYN
jgi:hypothetical protein